MYQGGILFAADEGQDPGHDFPAVLHEDPHFLRDRDVPDGWAGQYLGPGINQLGGHEGAARVLHAVPARGGQGNHPGHAV